MRYADVLERRTISGLPGANRLVRNFSRAVHCWMPKNAKQTRLKHMVHVEAVSVVMESVSFQTF